MIPKTIMCKPLILFAAVALTSVVFQSASLFAQTEEEIGEINRAIGESATAPRPATVGATRPAPAPDRPANPPAQPPANRNPANRNADNGSAIEIASVPTSEASEKVKEFRQTVLAMRDRKLRINQLIGNIPLGFPEKQKKSREEIERLRVEVAALEAALGPLAIEAYKEAPNTDRAVFMAVIASLNASLNPKPVAQAKFNPALAYELASLMADNGIDQPQVLFAAFRAAFATQNFDDAQRMLDRLQENGSSTSPRVAENLAAARENWARELEIRRMESETGDLPLVRFETSVGEFTVELFENHAPDTINNFVHLVEIGYYDGLTFHLVRPGTMVKGGCPLGNGNGHPGYRIACECDRDEIRHHFAGSLSMANHGRNTGGGQIFFAQQPNPGLDGKYTVFGRIVENEEVLYDFPAMDKSSVIPDAGRPETITRVTVIRKRDHLYLPIKVKEELPVDPRPMVNGRIVPRVAPSLPPRVDPRIELYSSPDPPVVTPAGQEDNVEPPATSVEPTREEFGDGGGTPFDSDSPGSGGGEPGNNDLESNEPGSDGTGGLNSGGE